MRAQGDRETNARTEGIDRLASIVSPPHLPAAAEYVPDLLNGPVMNGA